MQQIRSLSTELQKKAIEELNEDPTRIEEGLQHIKDWLEKQPHLNPRKDDQFLVNFARGCKWRMQIVKKKLDIFYSMRTLVPEFFTDRDPFRPEIQKVLEAGILFPLPYTSGSSGPRILFYNISNFSMEHTPFDVMAKVFFMSLDILMHEDDRSVVSGLFIIGDYKKFPLSYIAQLTPTAVSKYMRTFESGYPLRMKRFVGLNVPKAMETFYDTILKPLVSEKFFGRMALFSDKNLEGVYNEIGQYLLPREFGGRNGSLIDLTTKWKLKMESYREWFMDDAQYKSKENLRIGGASSSVQEYGADGSFKQLNID